MAFTKIRGEQLLVDSAQGLDVDSSTHKLYAKVTNGLHFNVAGELEFDLTANGGLSIDPSNALYVSGFASATGDPGVDGLTRYNTTDKSFRGYQAGAVKSFSGLLSTNTAESSAIANTSATTAFSLSYTLPANFLTVGKVLRIIAAGRYSTTLAPTLALTLFYGSTSMIGSGTVTTVSGASNLAWWWEAIVITRTVGATGQQSGNGLVEVGSPTSVGASAMRGGVPTVDTTASQSIVLNAKWGTASTSNTIVMETFTIEALN